MNRYAQSANFACKIKTPLLRRHFVYRAFDADGVLLYVGCTYDPDKRMAAHRHGSDWHADMVRLAVAGPYNYETARQLEYDAIESERSLYNHSRERRELSRLHSTLVNAHATRLASNGMPYMEAIGPAVDIADQLLPEGLHRRPVRIDDTTLPRARRLVADFIKAGAA